MVNYNYAITSGGYLVVSPEPSGKNNQKNEPSGKNNQKTKTEKLQKVLARAGLGSRRACEKLIVAKRVHVDGQLALIGCRVDADSSLVEVDGKSIGVRPDRVVYLLNKPAGVVTTVNDPQGRPVVVELLPSTPRVFPVGRLDIDTEGLLLLTNDGELAHRLTHPSFGVEKEYLVHVNGFPSSEVLRTLRQGVTLKDGITAPAKVSLRAPDVLCLKIKEGRNRQVRRMCNAVGHPVKRLIRTRVGQLTTRHLRPGEWRHLTQKELLTLEQP